MLIETIFNYLLNNKDYYNLVFPALEESLFIDRKIKIIFNKMKDFSVTYSSRPSTKDVALLVDVDADLTEEESKAVLQKLKEIVKLDVSDNYELIKNETEQWVLHRRCELAVLGSAEILEKGLPKGAMVEMMKNAITFSLSSNLGIEYGRDAAKQFDFYTLVEDVMATGLEGLDSIIGGGFRKKALYLFIGKTNIGKTLWLCHTAAALVMRGYNVAYYTAEMSEEMIYKRLDANILDIQMGELSKNLTKESYLDKAKAFCNLPQRGRLFCKEYPTGFGTRDHILQNLEDLKIKEDFVPDAIVVDSVNIFASCRLSSSLLGNTYVYQRAVTEEFRAIGVEKDMAVISGTQVNRESANKGADKMDTTGTSDSWGIPATADWMGAIMQPQEMYEAGRYLLKSIKTRFDEHLYKVNTIGVDRSHMRLFDVDDEDMPESVKDRMKFTEKKRAAVQTADDTTAFLFDEDFE